MDALALIFDGINWVATVVGAIVLSIVANLLTPRVSNWWATTSTERALRRVAGLRIEKELIAAYHAEPTQLLIYLVLQLMRIVFQFSCALMMGFLIGLILEPLASLAQVVALPFPVRAVEGVLVVIQSVMFLTAMNTFYQASWLAYRVIEFPSYEAETLVRIAELEESAGTLSQ